MRCNNEKSKFVVCTHHAELKEQLNDVCSDDEGCMTNMINFIKTSPSWKVWKRRKFFIKAYLAENPDLDVQNKKK